MQEAGKWWCAACRAAGSLHEFGRFFWFCVALPHNHEQFRISITYPPPICLMSTSMFTKWCHRHSIPIVFSLFVLHYHTTNSPQHWLTPSFVMSTSMFTNSIHFSSFLSCQASFDYQILRSLPMFCAHTNPLTWSQWRHALPLSLRRLFDNLRHVLVLASVMIVTMWISNEQPFQHAWAQRNQNFNFPSILWDYSTHVVRDWKSTSMHWHLGPWCRPRRSCSYRCRPCHHRRRCRCSKMHPQLVHQQVHPNRHRCHRRPCPFWSCSFVKAALAVNTSCTRKTWLIVVTIGGAQGKDDITKCSLNNYPCVWWESIGRISWAPPSSKPNHISL